MIFQKDSELEHFSTFLSVYKVRFSDVRKLSVKTVILSQIHDIRQLASPLSFLKSKDEVLANMSSYRS